ncbi:hypothetical protein [Streptococcus suis]|uniref:hypothetical protein n=1 Tax=Streptococcus suis TaxID=1307 RepID=UPI001EE00146|nr:hypothetical protein [Streptococcus suis]
MKVRTAVLAFYSLVSLGVILGTIISHITSAIVGQGTYLPLLVYLYLDIRFAIFPKLSENGTAD